ncbi:DNA topoisomerase 6 subunit A [Pycnococcus provasolii]|uniref:DNA topoisomerase 6 subunit A n=1 Tax=Pycnococcus provasolii TaxID=41880 RepID=A0A830HZS8_9CHLO|nr:DNA topoisomerase 6 subunit A [Pycnococcus provasolii]
MAPPRSRSQHEKPASSGKVKVPPPPPGGGASGKSKKRKADGDLNLNLTHPGPSATPFEILATLPFLSALVSLTKDGAGGAGGGSASLGGAGAGSAGASAHGMTSETIREVVDKGPDDIRLEIEAAVLAVVKSILGNQAIQAGTDAAASGEQAAASGGGGSGFAYMVPSRGNANQLYIPELDRIVLRDKVTPRPFGQVGTVRKCALTTRVLQLIHELCLKRIHVTKRDLFYTDVKLFVDQRDSDNILDDVSCMLGCTRSSLHVVASEKGVVVGRLRFEEDGDAIDCTKMGVGGKAIPPNVDKVSKMESDALFILLVEKDAAFMRLAEDRFYNKYPCVIVTAKGQPDVATRLFLRKLRRDLCIPVLALVDSDPYGLKILSVYSSGSKNMSYDSFNLTTPDIKWLGVLPSDLDAFNIPEQCRLKMTDADIKTGQDLLKEDFVQARPEWVKELQLMVKRKVKAEIQALSSFGFQYLTEVYLPRKLKEGGWI